MELQFLGTGAGMPSKERNTTAIMMKLLDERGTMWLFDCGEATQHRILHTSLKPRKIEKIFITHLHGDHIFGLPGLLGSRSFLGGTEPLTIYGPLGIKEWVETTIRISGTHLTYPLFIEEIDEAGIVFEDEQFTVYAAWLEHVVPCLGYRIEQKERPGALLIEKAYELGVPKGPLLGALKNGADVTLADGRVVHAKDVVTSPKAGFIVTILGDTKYCDQAIQLAKNATIVVHEATFDDTTAQLAAQYGHATNMEAAHVAKHAEAKYLILTHISARFLPAQSEALAKQARTVFEHTSVAHDYISYALISDNDIVIKD